VLARIEPDEAEREKTTKLAERLSDRLSRKLQELNLEAEVRVEGSFAKDTWLASEKDIDIFVLVPKTSPREVFMNVIECAKKLGGRWQMQYAEHPYLQMRVEGYKIEVVPGFRVDTVGEMASSVDRTPFHTRYVNERADDQLKKGIRLLKKFMAGVGCYGAELKIRGFSGYLCELLIIRYTSFQNLVDAASRWTPGFVIDMEKKYSNETEPKVIFENHPLIVIDPVDSKRNVAAAVSMQNFATFVQACKDFLNAPDIKFFFPKQVKLIERKDLKPVLRRRGTKICCMVLRHHGLVEDIIYPQLRKTERTLVTRLVQNGFEVLKSDVWADRRNAAVLVELVTTKLPRVQMRPGPVTTLDTSNFIKEHLQSRRKIAGPFIDPVGRIVFELERTETDALKTIQHAVSEKAGFGKDVAEAVGEYHKILVGGEMARFFKNRGFRKFISEYLTRCLPWYR
jgi:tRNA nucleotidyltransferase (CCA-adding enzyme)